MKKSTFLGLISAATLAFASAAAEQGLRIYWTDVEGGAATLIVTPAGESILIDTGMPGGRDPGRILKTAKTAGVTQIDHLVTTHFHIDHFGGAAEVAAGMPIQQVWDNGIPDQNPDNNPNDRSFLLTIKPYREMKVGKRNVIKPGEQIPLKQASAAPQLKIECLAAKQQVHRREAAKANAFCDQLVTDKPDTSDNANSIVLLVTYGDFQFFVAGDLTWNIESKLVCPENLVGEVDLYQVTHHGMDTSNNDVLVRSLRPTVAVMSNGTRKGCGPKTFQALKGTDSVQAIYQIHKNLREDKEINTSDEHTANLEQQCAGNHIEVSVAPNASSYTVKIPANGHSRTYKSK
ncbi:MAG TPA: MBL fold metallo-hydrolase [Methylomirabilota bacterium]|nr:MBL fold metallo-hydrolase [Methylomirabilota bacterium]